jgi:hypothetical protein
MQMIKSTLEDYVDKLIPVNYNQHFLNVVVS